MNENGTNCSFKQWPHMSFELCDQAMHAVVKACSQNCLGLGPRLANDAVNLTIHHKFAINERAQKSEWFSIWKCRMDNSQLFFPWIEFNSVCRSPFVNVILLIVQFGHYVTIWNFEIERLLATQVI